MRGRAARLARQAHNLEVVGSNPTPASIILLSKLGYAKFSMTGQGMVPLTTPLSIPIKTWLRQDFDDGLGDFPLTTPFHFLSKLGFAKISMTG